MEHRDPDVVLVGQLPPPVHGQAVVNELLATMTYPSARMHTVAMNVSTTLEDVSRPSPTKVARIAAVAAKAIGQALRGRRDLLVYPVGARNRSGLARDAVVLTALRPWFRARLLHVHTSGVGLLDDLPGPLRRWCRFAYRGATVVYLDASLRSDETFPAPIACEIVPNAVPDPGRPADADANGSGTTTVVFLSNLYPSKGPMELINAIDELVAAGVDVRLELAGGSTSELGVEELRDHVEQRGLSDRVAVLGPVHGQEKARLLASADLFCLPTTYEGEAHPLTLIEALAAGLPVISTRWRAIPSIVDDGTTGVLVPPGDPEALRTAIRSLADDRARRRAMSRAARAAYEDRFTLEVFRERMTWVIEQAATRGRGDLAAPATVGGDVG